MITLNGTPLNITQFPDHTSQVWKLENLGCNVNEVHWQFSNESEIIYLAQLKDLLDECESERCTLYIKYLPYGRQDKDVSNSLTFGLHSFAKFLNSLAFDKVFITDPHSHVALDLINNSEAIYPEMVMFAAMDICGTDLICYPDKGALSKYSKIYDFEYIYGEKVRDQLTGNITSYSVVGNPSGKNVLIVDDICDGGATFKLLAKDLLAAGAKSVVLFVTHGIFSRGLQTLLDSGIQRVFTQDGEAGLLEGQLIYRRL